MTVNNEQLTNDLEVGALVVNRRAAIAYLLGIGLILLSLFYIGYAAARADAVAPRGAVVILPVRNDAAFLFEPTAVTDWGNSYDGMVMTELINTRMLRNQGAVGFAQMSSVEWEHFSVNHLSIVHGSPPAANAEGVVILCENMAFALFGATEVVSKTVQLGDIHYTIIGVAEAFAESARATDGFAWVFGEEAEAAGVLYLSPSDYNPLSARLDAERFLRDIGHSPRDYTITDANAYSGSLTMRMQLLLILCFPLFIFFAIQWLIHLFQSAKSKGSYLTAWIFSLITLLTTAFFIWIIADVDLWIPAYVGEGLSGISQIFFNTELLAPRVYLPPHLAALWDLNLRANVAFGAGLFGILLILLVRFITGGRRMRNALTFQGFKLRNGGYRSRFR